jgi:GxxExxY protein
MGFEKTSPEEERTAAAVVDSALAVHRVLGPGLLESVYETCFCHELVKRGMSVRHQVPVPIVYDGLILQDALRLDVLINDLVICELKAVDAMNPVYLAQLLSQLRLTGKRLGFLTNFNVGLIKQGIQRVIL